MQLHLQLRPAHSKQGHGSRACYVGGCREPECKAANAAYQRAYREGLRGSHTARLGPYRIEVDRHEHQN